MSRGMQRPDGQFRMIMKRNLDDYRKEMKILDAESESLHERVTSEDNRVNYQKREGRFMGLFSDKWLKLMPGLMAILLAVLILIFLIISEVLKKD
jgi:hypothetical protein